MKAWFWSVLEIEPTGEVRAIKRAYARLLGQNRPDDDAEAFMRLREAYEAALESLEPARLGLERSSARVSSPDPGREQVEEGWTRVRARADLLAGLEGLAVVDENGHPLPVPDVDHAIRVFEGFGGRLFRNGAGPALAWLEERLSDREFDAPLVRRSLHALIFRFIIEQEDLEPSLITGLADLCGWSEPTGNLTPHEKVLLEKRMLGAYDALVRKARERATPAAPRVHRRGEKQRERAIDAIGSGFVVALIAALVAVLFQGHPLPESPSTRLGGSPARWVREPEHALRQAIDEGNGARATTLIEQGVDLGFVYGDRQTPLMVAVAEGEQAMAAILLAAGAEPNWRNRQGCAALHLAVVNADTAMTVLLLEAGADPLLGDPSPLSLAWQMDREVLIGLFEVALAERTHE